MTPEQYAALLTAIAAVIGALGTLIWQVRRTHELVNSRMTELLRITKKSALAEGALTERENPRNVTNP